MPTAPVTNLAVTLRCPFPDGTKRQRAIVDFLDFGPQHAPVNTPNITIKSNSQPSLIEVIPLGPLAFKVRTKAPKPASISQATVVFDDNRIKTDDGQPVGDVTLVVTLQAQPDQSSFESDETTPLVAEDEPDDAP